jgi:ribonucleoside-diphosphate reductase alpha chain
MNKAIRERLPQDRSGLTHRFVIKTTTREVVGFITANVYEDGRLAEVFCQIDKEGSTTAGMMDTVTTLISLALQYGVPMEKICEKLQYQRFEPSGRIISEHTEIHHAHSLVDYLGQWLTQNFTA